jgi:hypothetical protein
VEASVFPAILPLSTVYYVREAFGWGTGQLGAVVIPRPRIPPSG